MNAWPRISIVTPSFQQGKFLEETIHSVLAQGYPNLEYIVVDGGSRDGSAEILRAHARRLTWWVSEPDNGHADALNKGFARASGEVLGFLNSDDLLAPGALEAVGRHFAAHPACDWLCGACKMFSDEPLPVQSPLKRETWRPRRGLSLEDFLLGCPIAQPAVFWSRRAAQRLGAFTGRLLALDYEYWLRMLEAGCLPEPHAQVLAAYRLHADSQSIRRMDEIIEQNRAAALAFVPRLFKDAGAQTRTTRRLHAAFSLQRAWADKRKNAGSGHRRASLRAVCASPGLLRNKSAWSLLLRVLPPDWAGRAIFGTWHALRGTETDPTAHALREELARRYEALPKTPLDGQT